MEEFRTIAHPHEDFYEQLFREINPGNLPSVASGDAVTFMKKSGLSVPQLAQIWELSDYAKRGFLDKRGVFMALKLIAAVQQGHQIHLQALSVQGLRPPIMQGITGPASRTATPSSPVPVGWVISAEDQNKYDSIFESLGPQAGKLSGQQVRPVLLNSGLNGPYLAKIWELADQDKDGQLDRVEMAVALHLVYRALQGDTVPNQLPMGLVHPSKMHLSRRSSATPTAHMSAASPVNTGMHLAARSLTGSVSSLDEVHGMRPPGVYNSPKVAATTPQPHHTFTGGVSTAGADEPWPVDYESTLAQFVACDTDNDGLVNGMDVRQLLIATGLPQQALAQIWELVDINKTGVLNRQQFALIVHLVKSARNGEELPLTLPSYLVPPSLRNLNLNSTVANHSTPSPSISLQSVANSENPDLKRLAEELEQMMIDRREVDGEIQKLEAELGAKNTAVRNLQVELQTLENTVKQLERQKTEAGRRLGDLDDQIRQLETAEQAQTAKCEESRSRLEQLKLDAERGAESSEEDTNILAERNSELRQIEEEARMLALELQNENAKLHKSLNTVSQTESDLLGGKRQIEDIKAERERANTALTQLKEIAQTEEWEKLKKNPELLTLKEKPSMFEDSLMSVPSTSAPPPPTENSDPFTNTNNGHTTQDPFAGSDPFASAPSGGVFAAAFPSDPFNENFTEPATNNKEAVKVPPRPAPPKGSARNTPQPADPFANVDPFAGPPTTEQSGSGFANFDSFGAFPQ